MRWFFGKFNGISEKVLHAFLITSKITFQIPPIPPLLRDCVVIMMEGGFRRDRQSGSSALECGRLKLWVIGLLRNGILFMGLDLRS